MSDAFYIGAILMLTVTLFSTMSQRTRFRDRADEAEFKLHLSRIEIAHLKEKLEAKNETS